MAVSVESDATKAIRKGYFSIRKALYNNSSNDKETAAYQHEAGSLHSKMCKLETAALIIIWSAIL